MSQAQMLSFGEAKKIDDSLSANARGLVGSEILKIASDVRKMIKSGRRVCNLTVGDFDSKQFPIPAVLLDHIRDAFDEGQTNYPPSDGIGELRDAIAEFTGRNWNVHYPRESVLVASGARPILYGAYRCVVDPGDTVVYPVPSWNNNHYVWMSGAKGVPLATRPEDGFMPTFELLEPHLREARMICLNSPLNPTGTLIGRETLQAIAQAVVDENRRREKEGRRHLFLLHDQVYASLVFGDARHYMPAELVPEAAPWVISLDGISKAFAGTGLRVGWLLAAPELTARMKSVIGHVGAWAPRPEQVATARFLSDGSAVQAFQSEMNGRVQQRLDALYDGFRKLADAGHSVECIAPQGAIYLSLRLGLVGRSYEGQPIDGNKAIRKLLLDEAGLAVVPFQAFGYPEDNGWFRLSVGAVSMGDIDEALPRLRSLLEAVS